MMKRQNSNSSVSGSTHHLLEENLDTNQWKAMAIKSARLGVRTCGVGNPGESKILRFNPDALKKL